MLTTSMRQLASAGIQYIQRETAGISGAPRLAHCRYTEMCVRAAASEVSSVLYMGTESGQGFRTGCCVMEEAERVMVVQV